MCLNQDPFCSYCSAAIESASHFLCLCDYFATLRMRIWGKLDLYPADIDTATVGDIARFIKKVSEIPIEYPALTGITGDG